MKLSGDSILAALAFESSTNQNDMFGANGLPLTPPSITMVGNFHSFIRSFNSSQQLTPYLIHYLDCIRSKNEKITLIFEHYSTNALNIELSSEILDSILKCGLYGLYHLHYIIGAVHGLVTPSAFLYTGNEKVPFKLTHWAINIVTDMGRLCQTGIYPDDFCFISPEQLLMKPTKKSDIWSLALSILYLMFPKNREKFHSDILFFTDWENYEDLFKLLEINPDSLTDKWKKFFMSTLNFKPSNRLTIKELINLMQLPQPEYYNTYEKFLRTKSYHNINDLSDEEFFKINNFMDIHELYYIWSIAYPTKETDKEEKKIPIILLIPRLTILENESLNQENYDRGHRLSENDNLVEKLQAMDFENLRFIKVPSKCDFKILRMDIIDKRLRKLSDKIFAPILISTDLFENKESKQNCESLPLPIREMDFDYQCERLFLFKALLNGYPFLLNQLIAEAKIDICPHYRAQIWSSLLNVRWKDKLEFEKIDKISKTSTDRQIAVDIPRCHQYNDLLASSEGHKKLTRILKAWLAHNESNGEVYWQGLDSLAAPFVILNFNNESQAFACFDHFVKKYLHGFFKKDNSSAIQEYLALFQSIIAFHDPILSNHLASLKFVPDLYAISWFLTMFTHILPLYQIFQLWDTLILGNESFPLFIGLSILHQLRDRILNFTFNDCILIFSDLPQIDIDRCVRNSVKFFNSTPKSTSKRLCWEIDLLKKFPRLPRIKIEDLTTLVEKNANNCNEQQQTSICADCGRNTQMIIVDCRSKDDVSKHGSFINSIKYDDFSNELQKELANKNNANNNNNNNNNYHYHQFNRPKCHYHQYKHDLVVVVNSIDKCLEIIEKFSIPHVCHLEIIGTIPKSLQP